MKRLELEIVKKVLGEGSEWYEVCVKNQTHRQEEFGLHGIEFVAKNKIKLRSVGCPQWKPYERMMFVRGYDRNKDEQTVSISVGDYRLLSEAVKEYNDTFGPKMSDIIDDNLFEVQ
jgi:hypothetical protein